MTKFIITLPLEGIKEEIIGFNEAEKRAKELYEEYEDDADAYYNDEFYVTCTEYDLYGVAEPYILRREYDSNNFRWFKKTCIGILRDLYNFEKKDLEDWCTERAYTLEELNEEQLKQLRKEINLGSMYLDDYNNSFNVDTNYLFDVAEAYERYCKEEALEDTLEAFANYVLAEW